MTVVDYILIGIILISTLISLFRGFAREALSLVSWVAAAWVALTFADVLAPMFEGAIQSESIRHIAAFITLFVVTVIIGGLINHFVGMLIDKTGLSGTDRALGMVFGLARGALIVTALVVIGNYLFAPDGDGGDGWEPWTRAAIVPRFQPLAQRLQSYLWDEAAERADQIQTGT